ncbi:DUF2057 family protein [Vibrio navarrensis]|uniref:DUF2057 family protein n=1 Tax=Vibrio navarrensis TaxID=29495 RepID=UPI00051E05DE|nr:DUF2057 family protein [Vibrio navarrensis]KGK13576.1 hypothetical protein EA24_16290 [Vibrio navarrensis]
MFYRSFAMLAALVSFNGFSSVQLRIPDGVDLLSANMNTPKTEGGLFSSFRTIELENGINQIVFQYKPSYDVKDEVRKVYSDVIIASFSAENETLTLSVPKFRSYKLAKESISPLQWELLNSREQVVSVAEDILPSDGIQLGRDYSEEAKSYNIAGGIASVAVTYVTANQHQQPVVSPKLMNKQQAVTQNSADSTVLDIMKATYQKASPKDQEAFKKWLLAQ